MRVCVNMLCVCVCVCVGHHLLTCSGYEALRSMGKLKEGEGGDGDGEGEGGERGGVVCDRVSEDGMRSDGEASDPAEDDHPSPQV